MSLRRYNFAITKDMVDTAKRIGMDISGADVTTVLAAPLVCPNFDKGFDISSGSVLKDLRSIPEFGRGRNTPDYLSLNGNPSILAKMGHRPTGLPLLHHLARPFCDRKQTRQVAASHTQALLRR